MKKAYITPKVQVVRISPSLICGSLRINKDSIEDTQGTTQSGSTITEEGGWGNQW